VIISHQYKFIFFCPVGNCGTTSIQRSLLPYHDEPRIKNKYEGNFVDPLNEQNPFGAPLLYEGSAGEGDRLIVNKHIAPEPFFIEAAKLKNFQTDVIKKYLKFAVRRNPWDWALAVFAKNFVGFQEWQQLFRRSAPESEILEDLVGTFGFQQARETVSFLREPSDDPRRNPKPRGIQSQYETHCDSKSGESLIDTFLPFENLDKSFLSLMNDLGLQKIDMFHEQNNKNVAQRKYQPYYSNKGRGIIYNAYKKDIDMFHYEF